MTCILDSWGSTVTVNKISTAGDDVLVKARKTIVRVIRQLPSINTGQYCQGGIGCDDFSFSLFCHFSRYFNAVFGNRS